MHDDQLQDRFYWCASCDVYGRGDACWECGSRDVDWDYVPKLKIPTSGGFPTAGAA